MMSLIFQQNTVVSGIRTLTPQTEWFRNCTSNDINLPDQHRGMATAPAGNTDVHTPTLERLAEEGAHCPNAYANVPACTPNRGGFLTSQYPHGYGALANDLSMRSDVETIGETFQDVGYNTAYVGKWHLDGIPRDKFTPPGPRRHGFDHWAVYNCHVDFFGGHYYRDTSEKEHFNDYEPQRLGRYN
ncbi:sulfatase-like hydrolase/transferase [Halocatena marina]|uniref:Sulfatase-like hydrolase/transferase n=1 Tax=Halocatena marina TaxID=2934937 RepID=A0ABD5YYV8_9EURY|nr:sulfatase-like hydrolase/transferase [Halocatena marina]